MKALRDFMYQGASKKTYIGNLASRDLLYVDGAWEVLYSGAIRERKRIGEVILEYASKWHAHWSPDLNEETAAALGETLKDFSCVEALADIIRVR